MLLTDLGGCDLDTGCGLGPSSRGCGVLEGAGVLDVDGPGRPSDRPEIAGSETGVCNRGDGTSEGTGRVGAVGSLFPTFVVRFVVLVVGPGVGEVGLGGIAEGGVDSTVVTTVVTLFLIVLSKDSRPSSVAKPRSSWENIAAVISPMKSKGSLSPSAAEFAERIVDMLEVALCWGLDMTLNPDWGARWWIGVGLIGVGSSRDSEVRGVLNVGNSVRLADGLSVAGSRVALVASLGEGELSLSTTSDAGRIFST